MPRQMIGTEKIMRIYRLRQMGLNYSDISKRVGCAMNTVRAHLSGEYLYPPALAGKLDRLAWDVHLTPPDDHISLAEASFLIPTRPSSRTLARFCLDGSLRSVILDRRYWTRSEWVEEFVRARWPDAPNGLWVHVSAVPYMLSKRPCDGFRKALSPKIICGQRVVFVPDVRAVGQMLGNPIRSDRSIVSVAIDLLERCRGRVILRRTDFTRCRIQSAFD